MHPPGTDQSALALILRPRFYLAKTCHRLAGTEVVQLEQSANFDFALPAVDGRDRKPLGPIDRLFLRLYLNDRIAGDELLGLGEGAVANDALVSVEIDAPASESLVALTIIMKRIMVSPLSSGQGDNPHGFDHGVNPCPMVDTL